MEDRHEMRAEVAAKVDPGIPPYVPFQTFMRLLGVLKTDGIPETLGRQALSRMSGGMQGQLKVALRTMGLLAGNRTTRELSALVASVDTPDFERALEEVLRHTYPDVLSLDLSTATPAMLLEAFRATGAKDEVLRKCRTFFLHAAARAGLQVGERLPAGSGPRPAPDGPAPVGSKPPSEVRASAVRSGRTAAMQEHGRDAMLAALLAKFPDFHDDWPNEIKSKWFAAFEQLLDRRTG